MNTFINTLGKRNDGSSYKHLRQSLKAIPIKGKIRSDKTLENIGHRCAKNHIRY